MSGYSEAIIQNNLVAIGKGRTMLIISHRLSMIAGCDAIVVVDKGHIVGVGKHADMLRTCKLYRELWEAQNRYALTNPAPISGTPGGAPGQPGPAGPQAAAPQDQAAAPSEGTPKDQPAPETPKAPETPETSEKTDQATQTPNENQ